jgi:hypothetical protein
VVALSLTLLPSPARAQFDGPAYAFPVPDYVTPMVTNSILSSSTRAAQRRRAKRSKSSSRARPQPKKAVAGKKSNPAPAPVKLTYTPSASVTEQANDDFARFLAENTSLKREEARSKLQEGAFRNQFSQLTAPCNLSRNNIADVLTAYMVVSWKILHDQPNASQPLERTGTQAVQASVRKQMAADGKLSALNDTQKQLFAELLSNLTVLYVTSNADFRQKNDQGALRRFREEVRTASQKRVGADLSKIRFTSAGFSQ